MCKHIQQERGTVKCNRVNEYGKKTSRTVCLQGFWGSDKRSSERAQGEPQKVSDEMYISPRYLANIENNGQHPSLQIFFELIQRYNISVDQFLFDSPAGKDTNRRQLDALLDDMSDTGIRIVSATAEEIAKVEKEGR